MPENERPDRPADEFLRRLEELNAIAQNGLTYAKDPFDIERYRRLRMLVAEMLTLASGIPERSVTDWLCLDRNYATPKVDVRAVIMRGESILLVQERADGRWSIPGGWCDVNQSPRESVEKEVLEETGLTVRASRLLAFFDKQKHDHPFQIPHAYKCFFLCQEVGGSLVANTIETRQVAFVPWKTLPPLSLHRVTPDQLRSVVAMAQDPMRATAFD